MKKFLINLFFLLAIFILTNKTSIIYAQSSTLGTSVPGTCGNSEGKGDEIKCCQMISIPTGTVPAVLQAIPKIGDTLSELNAAATMLQRATNTTPCVIGYPSDINSSSCVCLKQAQVTPKPIKTLEKMCEDYYTTNSQERVSCNNCATTKGGVWTALGCIRGDLSSFITENVFGWGIGLAGLIALLCIVYSAVQLQTSAGNPEKVKKAQELLTSCIMGLMLIIFSIFILRFIGVDILRIPGFGKQT